MSEIKTSYFSYLLRLWRKNVDGKTIWQGSLQSSPTCEPIGFTSPDELFDFLRREMQAEIKTHEHSPVPLVEPIAPINKRK